MYFVSSYNTPIVAQDGTVCGKVMMELVRTAGEMTRPQEDQEEEEEEESSSVSSVEESDPTSSTSSTASQLSFRLRLISASGLPPALAHFVFCEFSVWDSDQPHLVPSRPKNSNKTTDFVFNYSKDFTMTVTEEFRRFCAEKSISVSVFGHKSKGFFSLREALQDRRRAQVHFLSFHFCQEKEDLFKEYRIFGKKCLFYVIFCLFWVVFRFFSPILSGFGGEFLSLGPWHNL